MRIRQGARASGVYDADTLCGPVPALQWRRQTDGACGGKVLNA